METYGDLKNLINLIQTKKKNSKIKGVAIDTIVGNIPGIGYIKSAFDFYKAAIKTPDSKRPNSWLKRLDVDDEMSAIVDDKVENGFLQSATKTFEKQPDDKKLNPDFDMNQEMIKYLDSKYSGRTLTGVPSFNLVKEDIFDKFLKQYSYKFDKGYPDVNNSKDKEKLFELVNSLIEQEEEKKLTKNDLISLIKNLDLDDKQIVKLYNRTKNFSSYRPIKTTLDRKKYNPLILKKFSKEIQDLIEDLPKNEVDDFINYLNNTEEKINFPTNKTGNLFKTLSATGVHDSVVNKIIYHTSQDEGKRGVGMGEVGMSLLFKNVGAATGKGDLSIDGEEFEIKGEGATLGDKPIPLSSVINDKMGKFDITVLGGKGGIEHNGKKYSMNSFSQLISDAYSLTKDKEEFKNVFKDILTNDNKLGNSVDLLFDKINFSSPESIQNNVSLMNFIRYSSKEGFKHFLTHDFGTNGPNTGEYIYVKGSPEEMANQLQLSGAKFERLTPNNLRPRIGFSKRLVNEE